MTDARQPASTTDDDALGGDLALDPQDAEQVTGGTQVSCSACGHVHQQSDAKCIPSCTSHGGATFKSGGGGFY